MCERENLDASRATLVRKLLAGAADEELGQKRASVLESVVQFAVDELNGDEVSFLLDLAPMLRVSDRFIEAESQPIRGRARLDLPGRLLSYEPEEGAGCLLHEFSHLLDDTRENDALDCQFGADDVAAVISASTAKPRNRLQHELDRDQLVGRGRLAKHFASALRKEAAHLRLTSKTMLGTADELEQRADRLG